MKYQINSSNLKSGNNYFQSYIYPHPPSTSSFQNIPLNSPLLYQNIPYYSNNFNNYNQNPQIYCLSCYYTQPQQQQNPFLSYPVYNIIPPGNNTTYQQINFNVNSHNLDNNMFNSGLLEQNRYIGHDRQQWIVDSDDMQRRCEEMEINNNRNKSVYSEEMNLNKIEEIKERYENFLELKRMDNLNKIKKASEDSLKLKPISNNINNNNYYDENIYEDNNNNNNQNDLKENIQSKQEIVIKESNKEENENEINVQEQSNSSQIENIKEEEEEQLQIAKKRERDNSSQKSIKKHKGRGRKKNLKKNQNKPQINQISSITRKKRILTHSKDTNDTLLHNKENNRAQKDKTTFNTRTRHQKLLSSDYGQSFPYNDIENHLNDSFFDLVNNKKHTKKYRELNYIQTHSPQEFMELNFLKKLKEKPEPRKPIIPIEKVDKCIISSIINTKVMLTFDPKEFYLKNPNVTIKDSSTDLSINWPEKLIAYWEDRALQFLALCNYNINLAKNEIAEGTKSVMFSTFANLINSQNQDGDNIL